MYWDDIITLEAWIESEQTDIKEKDKFTHKLLQHTVEEDNRKRKEKLKKFINKNINMFKGLD